MRKATFFFCFIGIAACGGDDGDGPDPLVLDGGRLQAPGCSFDVVTRLGAEAPVVGGDVLGADPDPFQIHLGLGGPPETSIAILWRTDEDTDATAAKFGEGSALDQTAEGVTYRYASGLDGVGDIIRVHEVHLCGLEPDTEYSYQVGGVAADDGEAWSTTYTFRTAPDVSATPDAEVVLAYVGDSRGGADVFETLAEQIMARAPDLLIYTGDFVTLGVSQDEWDEFFAAAPELLATVPMVATHGNHELNAISYYSLLAMPGDEENFSFDYGHAHLTLLNSDPTNVGDLTGSIATFLEDDLTEFEAARWKLVNFHRSIYSSGTRHGSDVTLRDSWGPVIDAHLVDMVISGHDHIFERTHPMRGDVVGATPADGTIYLVSGGAGAQLYDTTFTTEPEPFTAFAESSYNATVISVRLDLLTSDTFRQDGSVLDSFSITKP